VSRPISKAADPAFCPLDSAESERVFTMPMTFTRGAAPEDPTPAAPAGSSWSHFGHSHGLGAGSHSHGGPADAGPAGGGVG
jgi:hypothetical protein